jgi:hypothetical protein
MSAAMVYHQTESEPEMEVSVEVAASLGRNYKEI